MIVRQIRRAVVVCYNTRLRIPYRTEMTIEDYNSFHTEHHNMLLQHEQIRNHNTCVVTCFVLI